ncbi:MAG: LicD family protein [Clostridia bacterium]|nr:LicD family protein [Clostridia bacterium]
MRKLSTEEIKKIELEILEKVDMFCQKHNITYFLAYGTLLGAIRHKGFIPWDDDIDIQMPREDYERFIKVFEEANEYENLKVISPYSSISKHTYVKVIDTRTIKKEERVYYADNESLGIDIDVFPLDGQPEKLEDFEKWYNKKYRLYRLHNVSIIDPKALSIKKRIVRPFIKFLGRDKKYLRKAEKLNNEYAFSECEYVGSTAGLSNSKRNRYHRTCYEKTIDVLFDGHTFKAPVGYDEILTAMYGDYMKPPKSTQSTHVNECYLKEKGDN